MIPKHIVSKILWSTIEDDIGLWEVIWELDSLEFAQNNLRESASKIINYLSDSGLINIYKSKWGSEELSPLDRGEANTLMTKDKFWEAPAYQELCIKVGATPKGEEFYQNDRVEDIQDE